MDSGDKPDDEPMYTKMLEDIRNRSKSHPNVNRREARYKIRDRIKQRQLEGKGALKATQNMGKGLHKVLKTVVKGISQDSPLRFSDDTEETLAKGNSKGDKYLIKKMF